MKKVAIFGSYNGISIGDTAILLGLLCSLQRVYGSNLTVNLLLMHHIDISKEIKLLNITFKINTYVITQFTKTDSILEGFYLIFQKLVNKVSKKVLKEHTIKKALKETEHLFIGGGNLIMDLYKQSPKLINTITNLANKYNVSYSFMGIGAGPIKTKEGIEKFYKSLSGAKKIYVRDSYSRNLLKKLYPNLKCNKMPDLALGINIKRDNNISQRDTLLINAASVYAKDWPIVDYKLFNIYIENMFNTVKEIINIYGFKKTVIFYSNYPTDTEGGKELIKKLKELNLNIEEIDTSLNVLEIIKLAHSAKITFVTRLHAGIMGFLGGSKIVAVAYQPKVEYVLKENKITENIFDLNFNNYSKFIKDISFNSNKTDLINIQNQIDEVLKEILK